MPIVDAGPLSLSELLDRMFAIYRRYFPTLIGTTALPFLLLIPTGAIVGAGVFAAARSGRTPEDFFGIGIAAILVVYFVLIVAYTLSWIAVTAAVWEIQLGRKPTVRGSYRAAWRQLWKAILAGILIGLAIIAGSLMLIVPGVIFALAFSLTGPVILAEGAGPTIAMSRSWDLTKGYKGKVFVTWLICVGISFAMTYALQVPFLVVSAFTLKTGSGPIWYLILSNLCSVIGSILAAPLQTIGLCLIYYDARVRKEGFDLQMMIDSLAPASAAPPAPLAG